MWADHNMHLEEAEEMINHAIQMDPNNGAYLDSLGWLDYRSGKFEQALTELLRAAQVLPKDDPTVFEHIGDAYAKLDRVPQALDYWQKAIAFDPDNKQLAAKIESTKTKMSKGAPKPRDEVNPKAVIRLANLAASPMALSHEEVSHALAAQDDVDCANGPLRRLSDRHRCARPSGLLPTSSVSFNRSSFRSRSPRSWRISSTRWSRE